MIKGEGLAVWLELSKEDKKNYVKAKKVIRSKLQPMVFTTLDKFNGKLMKLSETLPLFLHGLK